MASARLPVSPVVGLLAAGSVLLLIVGLLGLVASATLIPASISGFAYVSSGFSISLALLVLLLAWRYARGPSFLKGVGMIVLGGLSFLVGAGFILGGVLIVIAGALAIFAEEVEDRVHRMEAGWAGGSADVTPTTSSGGSSTSSALDPPNAAESPSGASVVVYRRCAGCGELNHPAFTKCPRCGQDIS